MITNKEKDWQLAIENKSKGNNKLKLSKHFDDAWVSFTNVI